MAETVKKKLGKNRSDYKRTNRAVVIRLVATGACMSRAELARSTGLSKMTITNIVNELIASDIIEEHKSVQYDTMGCMPVKLTISPKAPKIIGLAILRTHCEAVLCDLNLHIIKRQTAALDDPTKDGLIRSVYQLIDTVMVGADNISSIGIASIGPINVSSGMIMHPFYFYDIDNIEIVRLVEERYHLPVYFDNENQSAVMTEKLYGYGRDYENILFIGVREGVGCGVVIHNKAYRNSRGLSPELGHVCIDYQGPPCICGGRGCVERYINSTDILEKLRKVTGKFYSYADFCQMTENKEVADIFRDAVEKLSVAAISTVNILNPELIILGQDCVYWPKWCIDLFTEMVNEHKFTDREFRIKVMKAFFMSDEIVLGAACNSIYEIFEGHALFNAYYHESR